MRRLTIECPECSQSFDVPDKLVGEPVECGACQHTFQLSEEHIDLLAMRQFPGEKANGLEDFTKKAPELTEAGEVGFVTATYDQEHAHRAIMPLSIGRVFVIFCGIILILLVALCFILGSGEQGIMTDVTDDKRWILAGFSGLLGSLLIIFGFCKYRLFGVFFALVMSCGVLSLPIIYPERLSPTGAGEMDAEFNNVELVERDYEAELLAYKTDLGFTAVQKRIDQAKNIEAAIVVVITKASSSQLDTIRNYLGRMLETDENPRPYSNRQIRGVPCELLVYVNSQKSLTEAAKLMETIGAVTDVRSEMRVIEVEVDSDIFSQVEFEILVNEEDRNFFQKNLEELKFIDQQKQLDAVKRLTYSKEISLRSDIAKQLGILLSLDSFEHHADVVQALVKWDRMDKENAAEMVLSRARKLAVNGNLIPESYLNYVLEHKLANAGDVLLYCWIKDPILHEPSLVRAGKVAEKGLIELLPNLDNIELKSAINVLGKIGTVDALPSLLVAYKEANEDLKKSLKATIDAIKSRE